jgi:hypothetical protein
LNGHGMGETKSRRPVEPRFKMLPRGISMTTSTSGDSSGEHCRQDRCRISGNMIKGTIIPAKDVSIVFISVFRQDSHIRAMPVH